MLKIKLNNQKREKVNKYLSEVAFNLYQRKIEFDGTPEFYDIDELKRCAHDEIYLVMKWYAYDFLKDKIHFSIIQDGNFDKFDGDDFKDALVDDVISCFDVEEEE